MQIEEIQQFLPHRYPFLLVDRVLDIDLENDKITGLKNLSMNEQFFQGHFPTKPIMPGVLIVEAMAQLAGILALKRRGLTLESGYLFYLAGIDNTRFKKPVYPGDQLHMHAHLFQERSDINKFECEAKVDGETVCTTEIMVAGSHT
ncbi:MAG: 3-hydroxyacyl-ACP dehydratase FabZ [Gammaproteobacteria bacterium]|nr:3-hydroxyacyl-ACP dehydratase FabZ [Gammaproteobacteria bacterium]